MIEKIDKKPFSVISDPAVLFPIWIPCKSVSKRIICVAGFDLNRHLILVDLIDQLDYIHVDRVTSVDSDMSYLIIIQHNSDSLSRLLSDLPFIMKKYVDENLKKIDKSEVPSPEEVVFH